MSQKMNIAGLLSDFFSGTLTPKGKSELYHYIIEDHHKDEIDRKSTRLNSSHGYISYAVSLDRKSVV